MKNLIISLVSGITAFCMLESARAQTGGTVNFANDNTCVVTNGQTTNAVTAAAGVKAALYWAPTNSSTFTQIGTNVAVGTPLSGLFVAGTRTNGVATPGGAIGKFQVRAWGGGHATYEQALVIPGTLVGTSIVVQVTTGNPVGPPPTPPECCPRDEPAPSSSRCH